MIEISKKLKEIREEIILEIMKLVDEHAYNHPGLTAPNMLCFQKNEIEDYLGVSSPFGLIDHNGNYTSIQSFSTDQLIEILEKCQNPVMPPSMWDFKTGNNYLLEQIEFTCQRNDDEIEMNEFGLSNLVNNSGIVLTSQNERLVVFIWIKAAAKSNIFRCVYNSTESLDEKKNQ